MRSTLKSRTKQYMYTCCTHSVTPNIVFWITCVLTVQCVYIYIYVRLENVVDLSCHSYNTSIRSCGKLVMSWYEDSVRKTSVTSLTGVEDTAVLFLWEGCCGRCCFAASAVVHCFPFCCCCLTSATATAQAVAMAGVRYVPVVVDREVSALWRAWWRGQGEGARMKGQGETYFRKGTLPMGEYWMKLAISWASTVLSSTSVHGLHMQSMGARVRIWKTTRHSSINQLTFINHKKVITKPVYFPTCVYIYQVGPCGVILTLAYRT